MRDIGYIPYLVYLGAFGALPIAVTLYLISVDPSGALKVFQGIPVGEVLWNTFIFTVVTALVSTALGTVLAIEADIHSSRALTFSVMVPFTIPFTASSLLWVISFYGKFGWFSYLTGINYDVLYFPSTAIWGVTLVSIWSTVPFCFLLVLAGLRSVPKQVREASMMDELSLSHYYSKIALPLASKSIVTAFLMSLLLALGDFDLPYVMTNGGPGFSSTTLPLLIYTVSFFYNDFSGGSILALLLTAVASIPALALLRVTRSKGFTLPFPSLKLGDRTFKGVLHLATAVLLFFLDFPVYWMFLVAFRPESLDFRYPPELVPVSLSAGHFLQALTDSVPYLISSLVLGVGVSLLTLLVSPPASFSASRRNRWWLVALSIYFYSLPSTSFGIGIYYMVSKMGLLNTWVGLIIPSAIFTSTLVTWTMYNFFLDFPKAYEEAAELEGIRFKFFRVVLPLSRPFLWASFTLSLTFSWHLLFYPLILSYTPFNMSFPPSGAETGTIFALMAISQGTVNWGLLASSALIVSLPVMVLTLVAQRKIVEGLYVGGVKG